jgi:hypothetical protein
MKVMRHYSGGLALKVIWVGNANCIVRRPRCNDESITYE